MPRAPLLVRGLWKTFELLRPGYYRWIYGSRLPATRALDDRVLRWELASGMGDVPLPRESWDDAYAGGAWDCLEDAGELLRSSLIATLIGRPLEHPGVLDVGCGTGLLRRELKPFGCRSYTGIDLSREAIGRARRRCGDDRNTAFEVADAEVYTPPAPVDAVVLNESLYYLRNPLDQARRYHAMVRPDGLLVVSMFATPRTRAIGRRLARTLPVWRTVELEGGPGRWRIILVRGGEAPAG